MTEPDLNLPEPEDPAAPPPPASDKLVVPEPPGEEAPAPEGQAWHLALRDKAARWLGGRGIGPVGLSGFALAPAGIGALALATEHPGMGGILGGLAVLPAWLALAPNQGGRTPPFPGLVAHALVPLWLGGVVVDAAAHGTSASAALAARSMTRCRTGAPARCAASSRRLRELMASPSASRTMGQATISTSMKKASTRPRTNCNC